MVSRSLRDTTQVVTFLFVTIKIYVGDPVADQSQSAVGARGHPTLCQLGGRIAAQQWHTHRGVTIYR